MRKRFPRTINPHGWTIAHAYDRESLETSLHYRLIGTTLFLISIQTLNDQNLSLEGRLVLSAFDDTHEYLLVNRTYDPAAFFRKDDPHSIDLYAMREAILRDARALQEASDDQLLALVIEERL